MKQRHAVRELRTEMLRMKQALPDEMIEDKKKLAYLASYRTKQDQIIQVMKDKVSGSFFFE